MYFRLQQCFKFSRGWALCLLLTLGGLQPVQAEPARFEQDRQGHRRDAWHRSAGERLLPRHEYRAPFRHYYNATHRPWRFGVIVPRLPIGYATLWVGRTPYYHVNHTYFTYVGSGYQVVDAPAAVVTSPPPSVSPDTGSGWWYFCDSAKGYYPYVRHCPEGWSKVPSSPPNG